MTVAVDQYSFRGIRGTLRERLLMQCEPITETGCWIWLGHTTWGGYGRVGKGGGGCKLLTAHRASYQEFVGPIPEGMDVHHKCYVPSCINPKHLEPLTHRDNMLDSKSDLCVKGHSLVDPQNVTMWRGSRLCNACRKVQWTRQAEKRKASRHARGLRMRKVA